MRYLSILVLVGAALAASCASTGGPSGSNGASDPEMNNVLKQIETLSLAPGEIWSYDFHTAATAKVDVSPFRAAVNFLSWNDTFSFSAKLTPAQQITLSQALFSGLPDAAGSANLRAVVVGSYFEPHSNLVIIVRTVGLVEGKVPGHKLGIQWVTNAVAVKKKGSDETTLSSTGNVLVPMLSVVRLAVPYDNGNLVMSQHLNLENQSLAAARDDTDKVNLMDTYVKDERADNDSTVPAIFAEQSVAPHDLTTRITAYLNQGLYWLSLGNEAKALEMWKTAGTMVTPQVKEVLEPVIKNDIPTLQLIYDNWK